MAKTRSFSKFADRLTELVYQLSLDGGADEEVGSSNEAPGTWAGLMRGGRQMAQALEADAEHYDLDQDDEEVIDELKELAGVILYEQSDGSVQSDAFEEGDELEEHWEHLQDELSLDDEFSENRRWSRAYIDSLPDSHFFYVDRRAATNRDRRGRSHPLSVRHFPYKNRQGAVDVLHVRDALSRIPQSNVSASAKAEARRKAERVLKQHGGYR